MSYVETINGNLAMVAGEELMVSRAKKKAFVETLSVYYNDRKIKGI
jgi:hypothetical protein